MIRDESIFESKTEHEETQNSIIGDYTGVSTRKSDVKRSSIQTIFNISNTMMGTALFVVPVGFYISGLLTAVICAIFMCFLSYWTCNLIIIHSRNDETDYSQAIIRILGKNWERLFNFISTILLWLVAIIHYILMANVLYCILKRIFSSEHWPGFSDITFSSFSMQYTGIILFIILGVLYQIRSISILLAINDKGIYLIFSYCLIIIYLGIRALIKVEFTYALFGSIGKNSEGREIILFDFNLTEILGVFSIAFFLHNIATGMMKKNKFSENNSRDLGIGYFIVLVCYCFMGVFGTFAASALFNAEYSKFNGQMPNNILEFFSSDNSFLFPFEYIIITIALSMTLIQLTSVMPILLFFSKRQFFALFSVSDEDLTAYQNTTFNIIFNLSCLAFEIFVFTPSKVISLTGTIAGLLLIYIIPIFTHMKCVYFKRENAIDTDIHVYNQDSHGTKNAAENDNSYSNSSNNIENLSKSILNEKLYREMNVVCLTDSNHEKGNIVLVSIFYGLFILYGLFVFCYQIYLEIVKIINL